MFRYLILSSNYLLHTDSILSERNVSEMETTFVFIKDRILLHPEMTFLDAEPASFVCCIVSSIIVSTCGLSD